MGTTKKTGYLKRILIFSPVLFIFFIWVSFSKDYFFRGQVPFPSTYLVSFFTPWNNYYGMPIKNNAMPDVIAQIYPWKNITIESIKQGVVPVWNPHQFSGNPHAANVQSAAFTPFNLLFFVLPFLDAWSLLILLQPLLAGLFMYFYLRTLIVSRESSLVGSISFMFCSFVVAWMAYGTLGYALLFLPLFLYGIERYRLKGDWTATIVLVLSPVLTIFSGHFQTSLYVLIVAMAYLVGRLRIIKQDRNPAWPFLYILIGLAISSVQIIPTYHFYSQSVRSASYIQDEVIPWTQLLRIIAPDFYGNPVTRNDWVGHYAEWGTYSGAIVVFLAILSLLKKKKDFPILFFWAVFLVSLLFSFNTPLVSLLAASKIPVLSTSSPSRIVGIISFSLAVLGAHGLDFMINEWMEKKKIKSVLIVSGVLLLGCALVWGMLLSGKVFDMAVGLDSVMIAKRNFIIPTLVIILTVTLICIGYSKKKIMSRAATIILLLLITFEMVRFGSKWMPFDSREYVFPHLPVLDYLTNAAGANRVYGLVGNEAISMSGLYGIEGYDPLYIKRYGEFISAVGDGKINALSRSTVVFPRTGIYAQKALEILGVKYLMHSKGDGHGSWVFPFWEYPDSYKTPVFSDEKYEVYENATAYPRAFLVHSYYIETADQKLIDMVFSRDSDLRNTVFLEQEPISKNELTGCSDMTLDDAQIVGYKNSSIIINTNSSCASLLFLSEVYYPGWKASVDGIDTPIYRANYTFRSVPVPPGKHEVHISYENWYL